MKARIIMLGRIGQNWFVGLELDVMLLCLSKLKFVMNINGVTSLHYIQEAVTLVQDIKDAEAASRRLIEEAYSRGSSDNITCVVVRFESA
ncbi:hypothetical protein KY284_020977 [Solanum tuberosum]|nr:hypothetical protein KY284_020977 [Solanum tuberosum]